MYAPAPTACQRWVVATILPTHPDDQNYVRSYKYWPEEGHDTFRITHHNSTDQTHAFPLCQQKTRARRRLMRQHGLLWAVSSPTRLPPPSLDLARKAPTQGTRLVPLRVRRMGQPLTSSLQVPQLFSQAWTAFCSPHRIWADSPPPQNNKRPIFGSIPKYDAPKCHFHASRSPYMAPLPILA
jgi:hypothetical protein